jgi:hypothetical protein
MVWLSCKNATSFTSSLSLLLPLPKTKIKRKTKKRWIDRVKESSKQNLGIRDQLSWRMQENSPQRSTAKVEDKIMEKN